MQVTLTLVGDLNAVTAFLTGRDENTSGLAVNVNATTAAPIEKVNGATAADAKVPGKRGRKPKLNVQEAPEAEDDTPAVSEADITDEDPLGLGDVEDEAQVPSFETVVSQFKVFAGRHGRDKAIALLAKHNAKKIGDLDPKNYSAFYSTCVNTK